MPNENITTISLDDPRYPAPLKQIKNAPSLLYVRGNPDALAAEPKLAVVGTRRVTRYGEAAASAIVPALAERGIVIVSGLALGVDALAHQAALDAGGLTIAVLGTSVGWNDIGPKANLRLARDIENSGGAIISEYPPGTVAQPFFFIERNRIIAGLSRGTLVIEAPERSGALHTADFALDANRDVFAVPGPITSPASVGTNRLIRDGGYLVTSPQDILKHYGIASSPTIQNEPLSPSEALIMHAISAYPMSADAIIERLDLASAEILRTLSSLELKELITVRAGIYAPKTPNVDKRRTSR